ncbi:hypothetical protein BKA70DRAFT_1274840 [Coprinopsis sp. MPI-PUGE-AT-0042]|nr:hypothetical protein BKA70DRAFT_1274840 [Coprinopsis sp. MPI-PUGE-AT-0042]
MYREQSPSSNFDHDRIMSGFLAVFSEPGKDVTIEEFHDWYNNEHIPLRLDHLKSFLSGARYEAADKSEPRWLAMYEIDQFSSFEDPSYTVLREKRSDREAALIKRLGVLDRRTCQIVHDTSDAKEESQGTGFNVGNPSQFVVTFDFAEGLTGEAFKSWAARLSENSSWLRARVVKALDKGMTGLDAQLTGIDVPDYLAVLEFSARPEANALKESFGSACSHLREWQLYRAYPSVGRPEFKSKA